MELIIRQAEMSDVPALVHIEDRSFDAPWSAEEIAKDVSGDDKVYIAVALSGEDCAGYADMRMIADEAQLYNIAVSPEYRGQGIGEALLTHMIDKSKELGCTLMTLEVRASNEPAIRLYNKLGFAEVGRRRGYFESNGEDAVLMDRDYERR